jgi:hypothetical protein
MPLKNLHVHLQSPGVNRNGEGSSQSISLLSAAGDSQIKGRERKQGKSVNVNGARYARKGKTMRCRVCGKEMKEQKGVVRFYCSKECRFNRPKAAKNRRRQQ